MGARRPTCTHRPKHDAHKTRLRCLTFSNNELNACTQGCTLYMTCMTAMANALTVAPTRPCQCQYTYGQLRRRRTNASYRHVHDSGPLAELAKNTINASTIDAPLVKMTITVYECDLHQSERRSNPAYTYSHAHLRFSAYKRTIPDANN